jgi:hypothetical protein
MPYIQFAFIRQQGVTSYLMVNGCDDVYGSY